jgi:hypothetical protein
MRKFSDITAKNFPYVTVAYLFFIIIVNTIVKTKFTGGNYKYAELYGWLYSKNAGFLIPFIDTLAVPGLFINSGENDGKTLFATYTHIFLAVIMGGAIIELNYGHSVMALFIIMSMLVYYFIYIVSSMYYNLSLNVIIRFRKYNCCGNSLFAFLVGATIAAVFFNKGNTKLVNIISGILLAVFYIGYYLFDYNFGYSNLELKYYKSERGTIEREIYRVFNMELVKASFFGNSLNYLFGVVMFALFYKK